MTSISSSSVSPIHVYVDIEEKQVQGRKVVVLNKFKSTYYRRLNSPNHPHPRGIVRDYMFVYIIGLNTDDRIFLDRSFHASQKDIMTGILSELVTSGYIENKNTYYKRKATKSSPEVANGYLNQMKTMLSK